MAWMKSIYVTDFGAIEMKGYREYPKPSHPFGWRQRAAIKAIAERWWREGKNVEELRLTRED